MKSLTVHSANYELAPKNNADKRKCTFPNCFEWNYDKKLRYDIISHLGLSDLFFFLVQFLMIHIFNSFVDGAK